MHGLSKKTAVLYLTVQALADYLTRGLNTARMSPSDNLIFIEPVLFSEKLSLLRFGDNCFDIMICTAVLSTNRKLSVKIFQKAHIIRRVSVLSQLRDSQ